MPLVQVPQNVRPCQIEFGAGVERSKPGALYFTPSSTKKITQGELEHIQKHHPQLAKALVVVPFDESKGRLAKQKAADSPKAAQPRAKDKKSKAKQRAEELLAKAAEGKKAPAKPAPAPKVAAVEPVAEPEPEPDPEPTTFGGKGKDKKKK